jgi:gamma-glutamyltranspeptidase/glutathione hydrolase
MPAAADEHAGGPVLDVESRSTTDGIAVASDDRASEIGGRVLAEGGNAIDAAVAIQFALNAVEPHGSGIGGGGFMLIYSADDDTVYVVNSRERAPLGATPDMFLANGEPIPFDERHTHGNAVGVPGTPRGLEVATKRWGSRDLADLVDPAIPLAEESEVSRTLADAIEDNREKLTPAAREVFCEDGRPLREGETILQPDLADTLRLVREEGSEAFYRGEIADAIAETVRAEGGTMTTEDLGRYTVTIDHPTRFEYRDLTVTSMSPPSSGGLTMGYVLKLLEPFDVGGLEERSAAYYHRLLEAFRLAFADRGAYIGDDEFVDVPTQALLDEDYLETRRELIDPDRANPDVEPGDPWGFQPGDPYRVAPRTIGRERARDGNTTHFVTADEQGNVVSYTSTIEQFMGSGILVPEYGFLLNNELTDFAAEPGGPNEVQPEKRPMSSMSPTIALRGGEPFLAAGTPGGPTIITTVIQILLNVVDRGQDLAEAVAEPRIYSDEYPSLMWEEGIPDGARTGLEEQGHELDEPVDVPTGLGDVQALLVDDDRYVGVADPRRGGLVVGPDG